MSIAVDAAETAFPAWRALLPLRRAILRRWASLMREEREDRARLMTREQGKPLAGARGEIDYAAGFLDWFVAEGERAYGETIPSDKPNSLGVEAGIPTDVFQVLAGVLEPIAERLIDQARVRALSLTGSTEIVRLLLGRAAGTVKKVSMELGGHAPFIVFDDARLDLGASRSRARRRLGREIHHLGPRLPCGEPHLSAAPPPYSGGSSARARVA